MTFPQKGVDAGFTLIEVLLAVVILAVGITVILRAFETGIVALDAARDRLAGVLLIRHTSAAAEEEFVRRIEMDVSSGRYDPPFERYGWRLEFLPQADFSGLSQDTEWPVDIYEMAAEVKADNVMRGFNNNLWVWRALPE